MGYWNVGPVSQHRSRLMSRYSVGGVKQFYVTHSTDDTEKNSDVMISLLPEWDLVGGGPYTPAFPFHAPMVFDPMGGRGGGGGGGGGVIPVRDLICKFLF